MTRHFSLLLSSLLFLSFAAQAQATKIEGRKVGPVEIRDASNNPMPLPYFGKKNLMIFYVDPDKHKQNKEFVDYLAEHQINSPEIVGYGVTNLKDAPLFPNSVMRAVMRSKQKSTGAAIYTDPEHLLSNAWKLGDCNDKFIVMLVNKQGVIEFYRWGDFTEKDKADFYRVIDKWKAEAKK